jgi:DNA-binding HxlR family transcriptional regulator
MTVVDTNRKICVESLKLLGDFWTLRIINALSDTEMRFCDLQRAVGNVNPATLTDRLKKLEDGKLISRKEEAFDKCSVSYSLTKKGLAALPVLEAVEQFSIS